MAALDAKMQSTPGAARVVFLEGTPRMRKLRMYFV